MMNMNKWTMALAAAGVVSLSSVAQAQEAVAAAAVDAASVELSGYVASSYTMSSGRGATANTFRGTEGNSDKFSLDVVSLSLSSAKGEGEWASGYNVTMWIGDAASDIGTSDNNVAPGAQSDNTLELMEANIDLTVPVGSGLNLTVGQIGTVVGYETYDYTANAFYNRSWAFAAEPTHHTGIMAEYQLSEQVGVGAGIVNDSTNAVTNNTTDDSAVGYLLSATYGNGFMAEEGFDVSVGAVLDMGVDGEEQDVYYYQVGLPIEGIVPNLTADFAATLVDHDRTENNDTELYQLYVGYELNDTTSLNVRYEFGDDDITAGKSDIKSYAVGISHDLWANVSSRIEYMTSDYEGAANDDEALTISLVYSF
tara:strand:+ start:319 stop:1419 length:1101 start_codon:yes stop_codon:yes gene_type:complete